MKCIKKLNIGKLIKFTLIELLVVIAIISILASMLLPALKKAQDSTKRIACVNKTKQIGTAIFMYTNDYDGFLPATYVSGVDYTSWHRWIIPPYMGLGSDPQYAEQYVCPCDKHVWKHPTDGYLTMDDPSFGLTTQCGVGTPTNPYVKLINFKHPSKKVMLGERQRTQEGGTGTGHSFEVRPARLYNYRHGNGSNVFWMDNHATQETSNRINEINSSNYYWLPGW